MAKKNNTATKQHDAGMTYVALFGDNAFDFVIDESEDQGTLTSTVAALSKATNSLMRMTSACENREEIDQGQLENTLAEARIGIEFVSGMCACLADDLARRSEVHHG